MADLQALKQVIAVKQRERDQAVARRDAAAETARPLLDRINESLGTTDLAEAELKLKELEQELEAKINEAMTLLNGEPSD